MPYPLCGAQLQAHVCNSPRVVAGETRSAYVLCDEPGALLGYGELVSETEDSFRLARIIVSPSHRGQGLGETLCQHLMDHAQSGCTVRQFRLLVYRDNRRAVSLYARLGFVEAGAFDRPDVMWMQKPLAIGFARIS